MDVYLFCKSLFFMNVKKSLDKFNKRDLSTALEMGLRFF